MIAPAAQMTLLCWPKFKFLRFPGRREIIGKLHLQPRFVRAAESFG